MVRSRGRGKAAHSPPGRPPPGATLVGIWQSRSYEQPLADPRLFLFFDAHRRARPRRRSVVDLLHAGAPARFGGGAGPRSRAAGQQCQPGSLRPRAPASRPSPAVRRGCRPRRRARLAARAADPDGVPPPLPRRFHPVDHLGAGTAQDPLARAFLYRRPGPDLRRSFRRGGRPPGIPPPAAGKARARPPGGHPRGDDVGPARLQGAHLPRPRLRVRALLDPPHGHADRRDARVLGRHPDPTAAARGRLPPGVPDSADDSGSAAGGSVLRAGFFLI